MSKVTDLGLNLVPSRLPKKNIVETAKAEGKRHWYIHYRWHMNCCLFEQFRYHNYVSVRRQWHPEQ